MRLSFAVRSTASVPLPLTNDQRGEPQRSAGFQPASSAVLPYAVNAARLRMVPTLKRGPRYSSLTRSMKWSAAWRAFSM